MLLPLKPHFLKLMRMNFLHRLLHKPTAIKERNSIFQKVDVCYEANISFATDFLVHFYDGENVPFLLEKSGTHFRIQQHIPLHRNNAYFRVHVFNPRCLTDQTLKIGIKVRQVQVAEKIFHLPHHNTYSQWHTVKASLI